MPTLTRERLLQVLEYDQATGIFTWRARDAVGFKTRRSQSVWNARHAAKEAGSIDKGLGYRRICIDGVHHWAHRLAWFYVHGEIPPNDIDHKDRVRSNNRLSNLREASRAENLQNQVKASDRCKSGIRGVSWDRAKGKWRASISVGNRNVHLGRFDSIDAAACAYTDGKRRLHPGAIL